MMTSPRSIMELPPTEALNTPATCAKPDATLSILPAPLWGGAGGGGAGGALTREFAQLRHSCTGVIPQGKSGFPATMPRRAILMAVLAASACSPTLASPSFIFTTTDKSYEGLVQALRQFAASEDLEFRDEAMGAGPQAGRSITLQNWRVVIFVRSALAGDHFERNSFMAYVMSTMEPMPWALRGRRLEELVSRFEQAARSAPGVQVERSTIPEQRR